jgi:hypothetical protein
MHAFMYMFSDIFPESSSQTITFTSCGQPTNSETERKKIYNMQISVNWEEMLL